MLKNKDICPCGSDLNYDNCCGKYIEKQFIPQTAEDLMRSRYTAYTKTNIDYIKKTMIGPALKSFDYQKSKQWAKNSLWIKLEVINHKLNKKDNNTAFVEFKAFYLIDNLPQILNEISEFKKINGQWFYYSGKQ